MLLSTSFAADFERATLDQVLVEIKSLNEKVSALKVRLAKYEEVSEVPNTVPRAAVAHATSNPSPKDDKNQWYENLRIELCKAEVRASGDWVNPDAWDKLASKMNPREFVAILGEPMDKKFSIRKDTDEVLIFRGDLEGKGYTVKDEVRIGKGKVNQILAPGFYEFIETNFESFIF